MSPVAIVLNVEDNPSARFLRTRILERAGFTVDEAGTAARAAERAAFASLVLLDVNLPDGDGFTVCEQVKAARPELPVVMITSVYRTAHARRDAFAAGADAYLLEPIEPDRLVRIVGGFLEGRLKVGAAAAEGSVWIVTRPSGEIEDLSPAALALLNVSRRGAIGRGLPTYFGEDRPQLIADLARAADGLIVERRGVVRPRDRRPVSVQVEITSVAVEPGQGVRLRWTIEPSDAARK
jgi:CheY-like chemotaxis protein